MRASPPTDVARASLERVQRVGRAHRGELDRNGILSQSGRALGELQASALTNSLSAAWSCVDYDTTVPTVNILLPCSLRQLSGRWKKRTTACPVNPGQIAPALLGGTDPYNYISHLSHT